MSPNSTWLDTRTTQLRSTLLGLGLTITDSQARVLLNDKLDEYARLMHVTRRTAQRHFTDEHSPSSPTPSRRPFPTRHAADT